MGKDPQIILANIKRLQDLLGGALEPEIRIRVERLLAEAQAELALSKIFS